MSDPEVTSVATVRRKGFENTAVNDLFPRHTIDYDTREASTSLIKFLDEYYQHMNADGKPSRVLNDLSNQLDIDKADDFYLDAIQAEIAKLVPSIGPIDRRILYKRIVHFYRSKGTPESIFTFFRIFFPAYELPEIVIDSDPWSYSVAHEDLYPNEWHNTFRQMVHPAGLNFVALVIQLCEYTDSNYDDSDSFIPRGVSKSFVDFAKAFESTADYQRGVGNPMLTGFSNRKADLEIHLPLFGEYIQDVGANPAERYWNIQWLDSNTPPYDDATARICTDVSGNERHGVTNDRSNAGNPDWDSTFYIGEDDIPVWQPDTGGNASGIYISPWPLNDFHVDDSDWINHPSEFFNDIGAAYDTLHTYLGENNGVMLKTDEPWSICFWYKGPGASNTSDGLVDHFGPLVTCNGNGVGNLQNSDDEGYWFGAHALTRGAQLGVIADDESPGEGKLCFQFSESVGGNTFYPQYKSSTSINDNQWHHCAMVNRPTNGTFDLYVDGVKEVAGANMNITKMGVTANATYFVANSLLNGWITYDSDSDGTQGVHTNPSATQGSLIDYRVYSVALGDDEVLDHYIPRNGQHETSFTKVFSVKADDDDFLGDGSRFRDPLIENAWVKGNRWRDLAPIGHYHDVPLAEMDLLWRDRRERENFLRNYNTACSIIDKDDSEDSQTSTELAGLGSVKQRRNVSRVQITSSRFVTFEPNKEFEYRTQTSYNPKDISVYSMSPIDSADADEISSKFSFDTSTGVLSLTDSTWKLRREVSSITQEERDAYVEAYGEEPDATGTLYKLIDDFVEVRIGVRADNGTSDTIELRITQDKLVPVIRNIKIINGETGVGQNKNIFHSEFGMSRPEWVSGEWLKHWRDRAEDFASQNGFNPINNYSAQDETYDVYTWDESSKETSWVGSHPTSNFALQSSTRDSFPYDFNPWALYAQGDISKMDSSGWDYFKLQWNSSIQRLFIVDPIPWNQVYKDRRSLLRREDGASQGYFAHHTSLSPSETWDIIKGIDNTSKMKYYQVPRAINRIGRLAKSPFEKFLDKLDSGLLHKLFEKNMGISDPAPVFGQNSHLEFVVDTGNVLLTDDDLEKDTETVTIEPIGIWTGDASPGNDPDNPDFSGAGGSYISPRIFGDDTVYPFNSVENEDGEQVLRLKPFIRTRRRVRGGVPEKTYSIAGKRFIMVACPIRQKDIDGDRFTVIAPAFHGVSLYGYDGVKTGGIVSQGGSRYPIPQIRLYEERVSKYKNPLTFEPQNAGINTYDQSAGAIVTNSFKTQDGLDIEPPNVDDYNEKWYRWVNRDKFPRRNDGDGGARHHESAVFRGILTSLDLQEVPQEDKEYYNIPTTNGGEIGEFEVATSSNASKVLNGLPGTTDRISYEGWRITVANEYGAVSKNVFLHYDSTINSGPTSGNAFQSFMDGSSIRDGNGFKNTNLRGLGGKFLDLDFLTAKEISEKY